MIIMGSLFYYSMQATLMDYFFENDQEQQEKLIPGSGDQAQIMVDLANKQMAQQQKDTEIRKGEVTNQSLFIELNTNKASIKESPDKSLNQGTVESNKTPISESETGTKIKKTNQVQNGFVVVDCKTGGVIACPHHEVQTGTSPLFYQNNKPHFLVGRCLDVSIDVKTFCP